MARFWPVIGLFCLLGSGCTTSDVTLRKQVQLEGALDGMTRQNAARDTRLEELTREVRELRQKVNGTAADVDALRPGFDQYRASIESIYQRLQEMGSPVAASVSVKPAATAAAPAQQAGPKADAEPKAPVHPEQEAQLKSAQPKGSAQESYARAFAVYTSGDLAGAVRAFESFVQAEPASELAPNALYWAGECHYAQQRYDEALRSFERVVREYPSARKVPDAMLKIGYALVGLKDPARARTELKSLIEKYPKSQAAAKAREKVGRL